MVIVNLPNNCRAERQYIMDVILGEFLGLNFKIHWGSFSSGVKFWIEGTDSPVLAVDDTFFSWVANQWLQPLASLPLAGPITRLPQVQLTPVQSKLPVLFGCLSENGKWLFHDKTQTVLGIDIFGTAFFMLSRYEELVQNERDVHDRFPAVASVSKKAGFLDHPIIDEYVNVFFHELQKLWPQIQRRHQNFSVRLTHDVDLPLKHGFSPFYRTATAAIRDLITQDPIVAIKRLTTWKSVKAGRTDLDPYNTFEWLMDLADRHSLRSAFFFITDRRHRLDGLYDIDHPFIINLMSLIHVRGHEIGLHPSYTTYLDEAQTKKEFQYLKSICKLSGVHQQVWGGRQHFLRWKNPVTLRNWERAGLHYDSTLGFADYNGFRCGVCREYPAYDLEERKPLNLRLRPLIAMDTTFSSYMKLGYGQKALEHLILLKNKCRQVQGEFTLLWHNSNLVSEEQKALLQSVLDA